MCLDRCMKIRKLRLTADHPDLALTFFNQAELDRVTGKPKEAQVLYQAAMVIQKRALGDKHPALMASEQALQSLKTPEKRH